LEYDPVTAQCLQGPSAMTSQAIPPGLVSEIPIRLESVQNECSLLFTNAHKLPSGAMDI